MDTHEIHGRIHAILKTLGRFSSDKDELSDHDDLYHRGLKSIAAMRLMLAVEDEFSIELPETILQRSLFSTVADIGQAVAERLQVPRVTVASLQP
jgi:acyl carrier protein